MPKPTKAMAKIRSISIKNYKGIDDVTLELPEPRMKNDPDIMVIGSENGLGKTSILECCALLLSTLALDQNQLRYSLRLLRRRWQLNWSDLLIRAGTKQLDLVGEMVMEKKLSRLLNLTRRGDMEVTSIDIKDMQNEDNEEESEEPDAIRKEESPFEELFRAILGMSADPVLTDSFLFFHSYRKVQEENPELGMVTGEPSYQPSYRPLSLRRRYEPPFSVGRFKMIVLSSLMQQAGLFELSEVEDPNTAIEQLNKLLRQYAGGEIGKLLSRPDNTVEFRIQSHRCEAPFPFDGLSSGQKEIVSTLFLIWYHTRKRPCVVLIDEPELHLNAQWHRSFINALLELAPDNQYIVATHSEDVMDSVEQDRRVLLSE